MFDCVKIDYFKKHDDDISKLNSIQNGQNNFPNPSTDIISSARLVPGSESASTSRRPKFKNCREKQHFKFLLTNEHLIFSNSHDILAMKSLAKNVEDSSASAFPESIHTFSMHKSPIGLIMASVEGWLVCSCSDDVIILWKWDSLLKNWDHQQVAVDMGRVASAAICCKENLIYICLAARIGELFVIECLADVQLTSVGMLNLSKISTYANIDKQTELHSWLSCLFLDNSLYLVGLCSSSGVSLKVWTILQNSIKLKFRVALQMKSFAAADLAQSEDPADSYYVIVLSSDGYSEIYFGTNCALTILNRLKIEEPQILTPFIAASQIASSSTTADVEFRIVSSKFFMMKKKSDLETSGLNETGMQSPSDLPDLENSLVLPKSETMLFPELLVAIASTKGVYIFNARSGECEFALPYEKLQENNEMIIMNAQISVNLENNEINCALQPLLEIVLHTFCMTVKKSKSSQSNDDDLPEVSEPSLAMVSTEQICPKSVLRKKLKSPSRPTISINTKRKPLRGTTKSTGSGINSILSPQNLERSRSKTSVQPEGFNVSLSQSYTICTASSSKSSLLTLYNSQTELSFNETSTIKNNFETKMSDGLSYMRMAFSSDGNFLATCGNLSPLVVYKVKPKVENIGTYRDTTKVSSVGFSFNGKYMILATNDGKTTVLNWKAGHKHLLTLEFNSKFNEHIHSQFYYMDRFIVQPEDNHIVFYSYRIDPTIQKLRAGSFTMNCQNITALNAANQLYSNLIFCGGSNKSLIIFDANAEKVKWVVPNAHSKNISCIRLNEAPKGSNAMSLCNYFLTSSNSTLDPIKLWDLRIARCVIKLADNNVNISAASYARPSLSPCGRYIASAFEENTLAIYDVRKINSRLTTFRGLKSSILDTSFDPFHPMLWAGAKNGSLWNFIPQ